MLETQKREGNSPALERWHSASWWLKNFASSQWASHFGYQIDQRKTWNYFNNYVWPFLPAFMTLPFSVSYFHFSVITFWVIVEEYNWWNSHYRYIYFSRWKIRGNLDKGLFQIFTLELTLKNRTFQAKSWSLSVKQVVFKGTDEWVVTFGSVWGQLLLSQTKKRLILASKG